MKFANSASVTRLIKEWVGGNTSAGDELWPAVFSELRLLARRHLAREPAGNSLESAALVSEVYARFASGAKPACGDRAHFFAVCAKMMRQILVDHARARRARKRGHGFEQVSLTGAAISPEMQSVDLIALDKALDRLAVKHPRPAKLVELRFFSGLSFDEAAGVLGVVRITAIRDWRFARAFLLAELKGAKSSG